MIEKAAYRSKHPGEKPYQEGSPIDPNWIKMMAKRGYYTFFKKIGFSCNENLTGRTHPVISTPIARVNHFLFWNIFMSFGIQQMFDYLWAVFRIGK
ncbi:MAG: hypothetical protein ABFD10_06595 [Prolixibacteraceae bacterium]